MNIISHQSSSFSLVKDHSLIANHTQEKFLYSRKLKLKKLDSYIIEKFWQPIYALMEQTQEGFRINPETTKIVETLTLGIFKLLDRYQGISFEEKFWS